MSQKIYRADIYLERRDGGQYLTAAKEVVNKLSLNVREIWFDASPVGIIEELIIVYDAITSFQCDITVELCVKDVKTDEYYPLYVGKNDNNGVKKL